MAYHIHRHIARNELHVLAISEWLFGMMVKLTYCNASPLSDELVRFRNSKAHKVGRKEPHTHNTRATMIWGTE